MNNDSMLSNILSCTVCGIVSQNRKSYLPYPNLVLPLEQSRWNFAVKIPNEIHKSLIYSSLKSRSSPSAVLSQYTHVRDRRLHEYAQITNVKHAKQIFAIIDEYWNWVWVLKLVTPLSCEQQSNTTICIADMTSLYETIDCIARWAFLPTSLWCYFCSYQIT